MRTSNSGITLNYQTYPLVVGNSDKYTFSNWETCGSTVVLEADIKDKSYTSKDIIWEVQDNSVAEVDAGLVRARTTGFTKVRAFLPSGEEAYCHIVVIDNITRSTTLWIELNTQQLILKKGGDADIIAFLYPEDVLKNGAMNRNVMFESKNKAVAVVDERGHITAVSEGITEIKVISEDIGRWTSCEVQVISASGTDAGAITAIFMDRVCNENESLEGDAINELAVGTCAQMKVIAEGKVGAISWKSSNPYIASVDTQGKVTAYSIGEVEIYATAVCGGKRNALLLSVKSPDQEAENIFLNKSEIFIAVGEQKSIYGLASPAICSLPHFQWEISDHNIAEIIEVRENDFGAEEVTIRGCKEGSTFIKASYRGKTDVCTIHISNQKNLGELYVEEEKKLQIDQVYQLDLKYEKGTFQDELFWLSGNRECVTVNQEGIVKAYAPGIVKIFCVSGDSLTDKQRYQLWEMRQVRKLEEDHYWIEKLHKILDNAVYTESIIEIEEETKGQRCLRNLHVVDESITSDSVMLLWNRVALSEISDFSHYLVTWQKQEEEGEIQTSNRIKTRKLGYTAEGLKPDTDYVFHVEALEADETVLHSQTVYARTDKCMEVIDVTKEPYCAVGNGRVIDTFTIQKAIDDCPVNGTVLLPAGNIFYSGALYLKSNMTFQVEGILIGSTDPKDYPPIVTRWEGWRKLSQPAARWANSTDTIPDNHMPHASLINAGVYDEGEIGKNGPYNVENIIIKGNGMINGNGFKLGYNEGPNPYDIDGGHPVPWTTKLDPNVRGRAITIHNGRNVYIKDVTVCYSPSWTIHTIYCSHVTFDHITVISKGTGKTGASDDICILNGDGIDPDSSININVFDSFFLTGDDAVAIKSGRDREGNELNKPSAYIRVTDCASIGSKGGFCIGSEQSGGAHDILWQNLLVKEVVLFGLWIKASPSRGGLIQDIYWKDCILDGTQGGIFLEDRYRGAGINLAMVLPEICHNTFENIHSKKHRCFGIKIAGLENCYIHDILFKDNYFEEIMGSKEEAFEIICGQNIVLQNSHIPEGYDWSIDEVSTILINDN